MAANGNNKPMKQGSVTQGNETALMIEGLYNGISLNLKKVKEEIVTELKYSSLQSSSVYQSLQSDIKNADAHLNKTESEKLDSFKEELSNSLKENSEKNKQEIISEISAAIEKCEKAVEILPDELQYGYQQNQMIFESLSNTIKEDVVTRLDSMEGKMEILSKVDETLLKVEEAIDELKASMESDYEVLSEKVKDKVIDALTENDALNRNVQIDEESLSENIKNKILSEMPIPEELDYDKIVETVGEKTESVVNNQNQSILAAVAAIPVAENVDYTRIVEEVSEKVLERIDEYIVSNKDLFKANEKFDYDRVIYGAAEKVVESLPFREKINYNRISEDFAKQAKNLTAQIDEDALIEAIVNRMPVPESIDYDKLAEAVVNKMPVPESIDYDKLAEAIVNKMPAPESIDYDKLAEMVAKKVTVPEPKIEYDVLAAEVLEQQGTPSYEILFDEASADMIADSVVEKLKGSNICVEEKEEEKEEEAENEIAVAEEEPVEENENELVDGDSGLVMRLKKSFAAKLKQSTPEVKAYYSDIKNAFNSYKKLNNSLSWHGDRFNYGRNTVAKMNISGKTLCLYLALDPNDPEFKQTVYHQRDMSGQKAYEKIPFMIKIKSALAARKAIRLVEALANNLEAEPIENYEPIDYAENFEYASTNQLIEDGLIKVTKEKRTELNFD